MRKLQWIGSTIVLALLVTASGCGSGSPKGAVNGDGARSGEHVHTDGTIHKDHSKEGHAHGAGPHGGTIADWGGGKFHVELTVNHDNQEATVYVLGGDEKTPVPIDTKEITLTIKEPSLTTTLVAHPQKSDPDGKASRFVGTHAGLGIVREYEGSISALVDAIPYSGNFEEVAQDD